MTRKMRNSVVRKRGDSPAGRNLVKFIRHFVASILADGEPSVGCIGTRSSSARSSTMPSAAGLRSSPGRVNAKRGQFGFGTAGSA